MRALRFDELTFVSGGGGNNGKNGKNGKNGNNGNNGNNGRSRERHGKDDDDKKHSFKCCC